MAVEHHRERELTFDVDEDWSVPDVSAVVPEGGRVETAEDELSATYYDTPASTLRLLGLTLRYREGGTDGGWHLKVPAGDARTEVHSQAAPGVLPTALRRRLAGVLGDETVAAVATIRTIRRATRVRDADDAVLVEIADDQVTGRPSGAGAYDVVWREVEVELGPAGDEGHLTAVTALFDGARPAAIERKITHVLGAAPANVPDGVPGAVVSYVRDQCAAILLGDVRLRDDPTPEVVHDTRVGIRRLRSTLRLFDHVVAGPPQGLDDDLKWMANLLSPIRDADILSHRVGEALDDTARAEVERELAGIRDAAKREWQAAWDDPRYRSVMATLVRWYASVPVAEDVRVRPRKTLRKARRKVRRRLARATDAHGLHQARKAAKRLRYAADLLEPVLPKAAKVGDQAKELQTTLGEHQDLAVAATFVRELGGSGRVDRPEDYHRLADRFDRDATTIRSALLDR